MENVKVDKICFTTILIVIVNVLGHSHCQTLTAVVQTKTGPVQGITVTTPLGKEVDVFWGIPYAEPPLGTLRFKRTTPIRPWTEIFNATTEPLSCFQKDVPFSKSGYPEFVPYTPKTRKSEDCLTVSIWVPRVKPSPTAVMVSIYGGGHAFGSTTSPMYNGAILATEEQVIVVAMNYRIGSLGFLFLNHSDVPGNAGVYDQNLALKWIKKNIVHFGGDTSKITVFGQSSGAGSLGTHLLSPMSSGLITRAILQSGSPTDLSNGVDKAEQVKRAMFIVDNLGCDKSNMSTIVHCLQTVPAEDIVANEYQVNHFIFSYFPIVDGEILPDNPSKMLQEGRFANISIMTGSVKDEASMFLMFLKPFLFLPLADNIAISTEEIMDLLKEQNFDDLTSLIILHIYTGNSKPSSERTVKNAQAFIDMTSDYGFKCPLVQFESHYAKAKNDVFRYYVPYHVKGRTSPKWMGVVHAEELAFVFGDPFRSERQVNYTIEEELLSRRFMRYWANFAKTGDPNNSSKPEDNDLIWPRYTFQEKEYIVLAPNSTSVRKAYREKFCTFWLDVLPHLKQLLKK